MPAYHRDIDHPVETFDVYPGNGWPNNPFVVELGAGVLTRTATRAIFPLNEEVLHSVFGFEWRFGLLG